MDGSRRSRVARGSGTTIQDVNALLKQFKEMQKMMKGMASGAMPNLPGMPNLSGMSGRAAKKMLAQQAAGAGLAGPRGGAGGADFDMLSQLMGGDGDGDGAGLPGGFPGLPAPAGSSQPGRERQQGDQEEEEGRAGHAPKGPVGTLAHLAEWRSGRMVPLGCRRVRRLSAGAPTLGPGIRAWDPRSGGISSWQ